MNKSKSLKDRNFDKTIKIALLSSYTINGFYETLKVKMSEHQIGGNIYVGAYNQYNQEILKDDSELYNFKPNLTFLMIDTRTILGEIFYSPYSISAEERKKNVEKKFLELCIFFNDKVSPKLPINANYLMNEFNISKGKEIGIKLRKIEDKWISNNFKISNKEIEKLILN